MKRFRHLALSALALLAGLQLHAIAASPAFAQAQGGAVVRVETVREEPLNRSVPVLGRLVSLRTGSIAARIAGPVERIRVEVGDRVEKGQVIAVLDAEILRADMLLARSELKEAEADLETWKAEVALARTELDRQEGLRQSSAFSQARHEDAQKRVAVAEAKVERAEATVAIRQAALERKRIDLDNATVRAPYAGVVVQRFTEAGAYVNNGDPLVKLIGDRALEVEADVPYMRLEGLPVGREVAITLDDGTEHTARVRAVLPSENPLTRTRTVRFVPTFGETGRPLAESQSVTVSVPIGAGAQVVSVHKDAILKRPDGDQVYVVKDGAAEPRPVELGVAIGSRMEVLSGLEVGETVVIRGNERLQPGAQVRIEKGSS